MKRFLRYFLISFSAQVLIVCVAVFLLELLGIEFLWRILLILYIAPADAILGFLANNARAASGFATFAAGLIPMLTYSLAVAVFISMRPDPGR